MRHHDDQRWTTILEWVLAGEPPGDRPAALEEEEGAGGEAMLDRARRLADILALAGEGAPDPDLVARTWRRIASEAGTEPAASGVPDRVAAFLSGLAERVATLVTDTARGAAVPLAVRGNEIETAPRMLVYETGEHSISVSIREDAGRVHLQGQLLPREGDALPRATARVVDAGGGREVDLDEFGAFTASHLAPGPIRVAFRVGDTIIRLAPLTIGS